MHDQMDVPVAVLSSRPSLDLAINIWMPGYVARSAKDVDAVIDLTDDGGVIVIDLGDPDGPRVLRALYERQTGTPTVVVNVGNRQLDPDIAGGVVVVDSTTVADMARALDAARGLGRSGHHVATDEPGGSVAGLQEASHASAHPATPRRAAQDPAAGAMKSSGTPPLEADVRPGRARRRSEPLPAKTRGRWWSFGSRRTQGQRSADGAEAAASPTGPPDWVDATPPGPSGDLELLLAEHTGEAAHVIDLTDRPVQRDEAIEGTNPQSGPQYDVEVSIDPMMVGRSWIVLDELGDVIDSGSAVVAVWATDSSYAIVAGVGLAPLDADRLISFDHPIIQEVRRQGWSRLSRKSAHETATAPPLAECDELLAVAVPGGGRELGGVALIGRFVPFTDEEARIAVSIVADTERLDDRLRRLQTPAARAAVLVPGMGPYIATSLARAGWQLLDELFPHLGGAAAAVALESNREVFVPTAAISVEADVAARFIPADHPLMERVRERDGMVQVQAANEGYNLAGGLPLPPQPFVVGLRVDAPEHCGAVVLIARQSRFTTEELAALRHVVNDHRFAELLRQRRDG